MVRICIQIEINLPAILEWTNVWSSIGIGRLDRDIRITASKNLLRSPSLFLYVLGSIFLSYSFLFCIAPTFALTAVGSANFFSNHPQYYFALIGVSLGNSSSCSSGTALLACM